MIDNYLLQELVTFARLGTLGKTAQELNLTQPAITHSMKKLEDELNVTLFDRKPNKITLTETGKYAAREAKILLDNNNDFIEKVGRFEQNQVTVTTAANAPGPLIVSRAVRDPGLIIQDDLIYDKGEKALAQGQITIFLTNQPLSQRDIVSVYLGTEFMSVNLPKSDPLSKRKILSYKDLHDKTILSPNPIGFWQKIYENKIPNSNIIYQDEANVYSELLNYSILPYFTTNVSIIDNHWGLNLPGNRVTIPISDAVAKQKFYAVFLKQNKNRLKPIIEKLQDQWAQVD